MEPRRRIGAAAYLVYGFATIGIGGDPDASRHRTRQAGGVYGNHMHGWGSTMMVVWSLVWIGFLAVVAWIAIQWARGGSPGSASEQQGAKTARELLDERLARGDIDLDEYQRRRQALEPRTPAGV